MLRILSLILSLVTVFGIAIVIAGYTSAPTFSESITAVIPYERQLLWAELVNVREADLKKGDVKSVEVVDTYGRLLAWREELKNGGYRMYRMNQAIENEKLVLELLESSYGLTGIWTFDLSDDAEGTKVAIHEDSTLTDWKVRGVRYFFGRNHDLLVWLKYIKVGLAEKLLSTP